MKTQQRHRTTKLTAFLLTLSLLLLGCRDHRVYHHFLPVKTTCWTVTDTLRFTPDAMKSDGLYTMKAGVRVNDNYPYRDLWLVVEQRATAPHREPARRDTVHIILADSDGKWLTQGVTLHETEEVVAASRLAKDCTYEFLVYHIMKDQNLIGVSDVGLSLSLN